VTKEVMALVVGLLKRRIGIHARREGNGIELRVNLNRTAFWGEVSLDIMRVKLRCGDRTG